MPRGDGKGPPTKQNQRGGRMKGNKPGAGPGGNCVCPACGETVPHQQAIPCYDSICPKCGTKMKRE